MTRKTFIKNLAAISIATPFMASLFAACDKRTITFFEAIKPNFKGQVLIVGAGAAGLIAGHILEQHNIDFEILEASDRFGGRVKRVADFADFPIDLGGEWIHTDPLILNKLLNDSTHQLEVETIVYNPKTISVWTDGELKKRNFARFFYSEYKFKKTTWYGFFEKYIVPNFEDKIIYNSPITEIDYSESQVSIKNEAGETFQADKVLITVPIMLLQKESIQFNPPLPTEKMEAIKNVKTFDGIKAFIEFSERFYPDIINFDNLLTAGDVIYYDAAYGKEAKRHVLGLFSASKLTGTYTNLASDTAILQKILNELDKMFDGKASRYYQKHIIQNWSKEPYIQGAYATYRDQEDSATIKAIIRTPLENKVYFAGEAMPPRASGTVHGAGESGYHAVVDLLKNT